MEAIKKVIPKPILKFIRPYYHGFLSLVANVYYGRPSEKMVVVGVTGTAGKSTTIAMLAKILNAAGKKCGYITTVGFSNGGPEQVNKHGNSMPGRFLLHKQLKDILSAGCQYALVEVTSEGLVQNRHLGVQFDIAILTSLGQAHLDAHGGYESYKRAKGKLFQILNKAKRKSFFNKKIILINLEVKDSAYFLQFEADQKIGTIFDSDASALIMNNRGLSDVFMAENLGVKDNKSFFSLRGVEVQVKLPGQYNASNALLAIATANTLGVDLKDCAEAIFKFDSILGRMQEVPNNLGIKIIVDYAPEPMGLQSVLASCSAMSHQRLIHVFGSTGGHRDSQKRFEFGSLSAQFADVIFITNDDVYESDSQEIILNIKQGIDSQSIKKFRQVNIVPDRREAIAKAIGMAKPGDLIILTGKGSEQFLVLPGNKRIAWDEVSVIKEELGNLSKPVIKTREELNV